ncbi:hypothetical protein ACFLZB_04930 [Nanoarchaeota archaeon]
MKMKQYMQGIKNSIDYVIKNPMKAAGEALFYTTVALAPVSMVGCSGENPKAEVKSQSELAQLIDKYGRAGHSISVKHPNRTHDSLRVGGKWIRLEKLKDGTRVVAAYDEDATRTQGRVENKEVKVDQTHKPVAVLGYETKKGDISLEVYAIDRGANGINPGDEDCLYVIKNGQKVVVSENYATVKRFWDGLEGEVKSEINFRLRWRETKKQLEREEERNERRKTLEEAIQGLKKITENAEESY